MAGESLKRLIRARVTEVFNDASKGETPVIRSADALFPPDSVAWRVHGDVVGMLIGGIASLLLQMLHPRVLAGVWDHSGFRDDMHARLRGTAKFIARTTFGPADDARAALDRVNAIHTAVKGTLPDGTPYSALEPELLAWVHAAETWSFLSAWIRYAEPDMPAADQDAYFAEMTRIAAALGLDDAPASRAATETLIERMRPQLRADERSREVCRLVLAQDVGGGGSTRAASKVLMAAAVDLLPPWARRMHGLGGSGAGGPLVRAGAFGMAGVLRWAFADSPNRRIGGQT